MAHFARVNENNVVTFVSTCDNNLLLENGVEVRDNQRAIDHLNVTVPNEIAPGVKWVQTSYNNIFRKMYAGIGCFYSEEDDVFYCAQPYASWTLDENYDWQPPIPMPDDAGPEKIYNWDEDAYQADNTTGWVVYTT